MSAQRGSGRSPRIVVAAFAAVLATLAPLAGGGTLLAEEAYAYAGADPGTATGNGAPTRTGHPPAATAHKQKPRVVSTFKNAHGRLCRVVQRSVDIDGAPRRATGTVCQRSNGHWTLMRPPSHPRPSNSHTALAGPG
jgi:hypothetical protein